jgi:hypothetical protein
MKHLPFIPLSPTRLLVAVSLLLTAWGSQSSQAYQTYSGGAEGGCIDCHGDFRGATSTKGTIFPSNKNHEMHRASTSMATKCALCHGANDLPVNIGSSSGTANNPGIGCSGCHEPAGLRKHHLVNSVPSCYDCHDPLADTPLTENTKPPYYGTADTKAKNPANTALLANTNENWSIGDFLGLDNDGNNLYDLADFAVGPYRLLSSAKEGNNIRVTWQTAGGRTDTIQAGATITGPFTAVSSALAIPGVGIVTNSYVHVGGATNSARFYRLHSVVP